MRHGMTVERASELVSKVQDKMDKVDLFCHFELLLNPHKDPDSEESGNWQTMFASMCGFGIATNVQIKE